MKLQLLPPLFKIFNKSTFLSSLNQNTCPVLDAEEIKKQEQKEAIDGLIIYKNLNNTWTQVGEKIGEGFLKNYAQ